MHAAAVGQKQAYWAHIAGSQARPLTARRTYLAAMETQHGSQLKS